MTSYDLDKFLLLKLQFHSVLVAGTGARTLPFKKIQDDRGKRHTENVLLPLLIDLFHLFLSDGVTPHLWNRVKITPLHKKVQLRPPNNIVCWLSMVVSIDFCKRGQGLADGLPGLWLNIKYQTLNLVSAPQGTPTDPSLFFTTFSRLLKRKKWRYTLLSWASLLPTTVFQERGFGDTCKKSRLQFWKISLKPCTQDAYTFSLMVTKFLRSLHPIEAWNRAALWVPFWTPF